MPNQKIEECIKYISYLVEHLGEPKLKTVLTILEKVRDGKLVEVADVNDISKIIAKHTAGFEIGALKETYLRIPNDGELAKALVGKIGREETECPDCHGTGKEICDNPDHGFIDAIGVRGLGHANGCPCCGNSEEHVIPNSICPTCNGTGKLGGKK